MKVIDIDELMPGVILAENVYTPKGQLIGTAGRVVSAQLILHMKYYNVTQVYVEEVNEDAAIKNPIIRAVADSKLEPDGFVEKTLTYKLKSSGEMENFALAYDKAINSLKDNLNDILLRQGHVNEAVLLDDTKHLFEQHPNSIGIMSMLLHMREIDDVTYAHSINVALISRALGSWLGFSEDDLDVLTLCGLLHDVGKALIPNSVLTKTSSLTSEEFNKIKQHPALGYELLKDEDIDIRVKEAALRHHERADGSGYPGKFTSNQLGFFTQIITLADVYDAMTADRSYREGMLPFEAMGQMIMDRAGYNTDFLYVFLDKVSNSYIGAGVELSDGTKAIVQLFSPADYTRPVVCTPDYRLIDLKQHPDISIVRIYT